MATLEDSIFTVLCSFVDTPIETRKASIEVAKLVEEKFNSTQQTNSAAVCGGALAEQICSQCHYAESCHFHKKYPRMIGCTHYSK